MNTKQLLERYEKAKSAKGMWEGHLDEAYSLFLPNKNDIYNQSKGNKRVSQVYDSIGVECLQEFANNVKSSLLPAYQKWAVIKPAGAIESEVAKGVVSRDERDELARKMELLSDVMFHYIWHSNFDMAAHEAIQDMAVSLGGLLCLDTGNIDHPINFVAVPVGQLIPEPSTTGSIETVFREHKVYGRELSVLFPKASVWDDCKPDKEYTVIEGTIYQPKEDKYLYKVLIKDKSDSFYYEDEYKVSPWILFRWSVSPGETWGRGCAINALPSMRILNKLVAQLIYNNDMAITPPLIVDTDNSLLDVGNLSITPNSILPTKSNYAGNQAAFQYLQTGANFNIGENMRMQYHQQISKMFFLNQIGSMNDPTKSATEISIRNTQAMAQMSAAFGRLQTELVSKLIKRVHYILGTYGITPNELSIDDRIARVVATSPLAKVNDAQSLESVMQYLQLAMGMGEAGMAMLGSTLDTARMGRYIAEKMGCPAELLLSEEQQQVMLQQAQQQMAMQQQAPVMPNEGQQGVPV